MASQGFSAVGSCMAFSSTLPATYDSIGYAALTWIDWGDEVTVIGDIGGTDEVLKFNPVCNGIVEKRSGPRDNGSQGMEAAYDSGNAAQILVKASYTARTAVAVRETLFNGDVFYYVAIITAAPVSTGTSSDIVMIKPNFEVSSDIVEVIA